MQLASILSISCNTQHLAYLQSQHKLQWSMLWKRTFGNFRRAHRANRQSCPHDDVIMRMKARVASKQKESEPLGHCAAGNQKEACGWEWTRNALLNQWREREINQRSFEERNRWGKKASWRCRGSNLAAAGRYQDSWKHGVDNRRVRKTLLEVIFATGACLSDLAISDNEEDGEDEDDEETEQGKLSADDEPGWVMGTISKMVQQWMETFQQKQMKLDEMTEPR